MTDELRRAVVTESAEALRYHFGASKSAVNAWRRWAGVAGHGTTPGSRAAQLAASNLGAEAMRDKDWTDAERERRSEVAKSAGRRVVRWPAGGWTPAEDARLGTVADEVLAKRLGRSRSAVRSRRHRLDVRPAGGTA